MDIYELEYLEKEFIKHGVDARNGAKTLLDSFVSNHPGAPIPDYLKDEFCLPIALVSMVKELIELKKLVEVINSKGERL